MVDTGKELPNIALEHPCRFGVIAGDFAREMSESVHGSVRPLILATGIGIVDEETIEKWTQHPMDCVVNQTITDKCFVNATWLWIIDCKRLVWSMSVRLIREFLMKRHDMIHKVHREFLDIFPISFSA